MNFRKYSNQQTQNILTNPKIHLATALEQNASEQGNPIKVVPAFSDSYLFPYLVEIPQLESGFLTHSFHCSQVAVLKKAVPVLVDKTSKQTYGQLQCGQSHFAACCA